MEGDEAKVEERTERKEEAVKEDEPVWEYWIGDNKVTEEEYEAHQAKASAIEAETKKKDSKKKDIKK